MRLNKSIAIAALTAASGAASATDFGWLGGIGAWGDPLRWNGPVGQFPNTVADTAVVSGPSSAAYMQSAIGVGGLTILEGAEVHSNFNRLFVAGDIDLIGYDSELHITDSPSPADVDADIVSVLGGTLRLAGGTLQVDEQLLVDQGDGQEGEVIGSGHVEMAGGSDVDLHDALLWARSDSVAEDTLLISATDTSGSRLDWTDSQTLVLASSRTTLHIAMPYRGALAGTMHIYDRSAFRSDFPVVGAASSTLELGNAFSVNPGVANLYAPVFDTSGEVAIETDAVITAPAVALRNGPLGIDQYAAFTLDATAIVFDALDVLPRLDNDGGAFLMGSNASSMSFVNGTTTVDLGEGGRFDLDGGESAAVSIAAGSTLIIDTESIDADDDVFNGTLTVAGTLDITEFEPDDGYSVDRWFNEGEVVLNTGDIDGRTCFNDGIVRGRGSINKLINATGTIIAEGGTLAFNRVTFGLQPGAVVRAETGDITSSDQPSGQTFVGTMYIGDGAGVQEVIETNTSVSFNHFGQNPPASLNLNGGFFRARAFHLEDILNVIGDSTLRASSPSALEAIKIGVNSVNVIDAVLEADGRLDVWGGADFQGNGVIRAVNTTKTTFLRDGADLGSVGFEAHGRVEIAIAGVGSASAHSLALSPTSTLAVDLAGVDENADPDRLTISNDATVDGDIEVRWAGGDVVPLGQTYTIITAGSATGEFDDIDFSGLGPNRRAFVDVNDDNVQVFIACLADLDRSGHLDIGDVVKFLQSFGAQDDLADFGGGQQFDIADVVGFLNAFGLGCN